MTGGDGSDLVIVPPANRSTHHIQHFLSSGSPTGGVAGVSGHVLPCPDLTVLDPLASLRPASRVPSPSHASVLLDHGSGPTVMKGGCSISTTTWNRDGADSAMSRAEPGLGVEVGLHLPGSCHPDHYFLLQHFFLHLKGETLANFQ